MSEVPPSPAAREAIRELGTAGKFPSVAWLHEKWDTVRDFMRGVRVAGVPALSVVLGFLMFYGVPQVQDLFLEVRNNGWGPHYWVAFYLSVLVALSLIHI